MKKEIIYLPHRIPYPPNKGDKIRSYRTLLELKKKYVVHLATFIDYSEDWQYVNQVDIHCELTKFVGLPKLWAKAKCLIGLLFNKPLTVAYYSEKKIADWLDYVIEHRNIHAIIMFSSSMAQFVDKEKYNKYLRIIDFVDVDSQKWLQYSKTAVWPLSWVYSREAKLLSKYEYKYSELFDHSAFVSKSEAKLFKDINNTASRNIHAIENGVDLEYFKPSQEYKNPFSVGNKIIVFTGAMDYRANIDAVNWFVSSIFPLILEKMHDVKFYIVGSNPVPEVISLGSKDEVIVTGTVDDIRPYLNYADVAVAPLRIARGIQNKVLEAMSMALPIVMTSSAAEGIEMPNIASSFIVDKENEFANVIISHLNSANTSLGMNLRKYIQKRYSWDSCLSKYHDLLA